MCALVSHSPISTALEKSMAAHIIILLLGEKNAISCLHLFKPITTILGVLSQDGSMGPLQNCSTQIG